MDTDIEKQISERFGQLPKVVQQAIVSADLEQKLRELSATQKLHIDQWEKLQKEVTFTLLGFQDPVELPEHIATSLEISIEEANVVAGSINEIIFEPIREELERELGHPAAKEEEVSDVEAARRQILAVVPATPPPEAHAGKAIRASLSDSYHAEVPSTVRTTIENDPYREQVA